MRVLRKVLGALAESGAAHFPNIEHEYNVELGSIFTTEQHKTLVSWAQRNADTIREIQQAPQDIPPLPPQSAEPAEPAEPTEPAEPAEPPPPPLAQPMPVLPPPQVPHARQAEPPAFFFAEGSIEGAD